MNLQASFEAQPENLTTLHIRVIQGDDASSLPPLVLLHGWGCDSNVWGDFTEVLGQMFPSRNLLLVDLPGFGKSAPLFDASADTILQSLEKNLPERVVLIGWSLGGMLATAFAARKPDRVAALICLATNASYRQRKGWVQAIPAAEFEAFEQLLLDNQAKCLKRFRANQVLGDHQEKPLLRQLTDLAPAQAGSSWAAMLTLLDKMDNRETLVNLEVDSLHLFGDQDRLVPASAAHALREINSKIQTEILCGAGHALHLSQPQKLAQKLRNWLDSLEESQQQLCKRERDKKLVADSFSRSAANYDRVAHLQRAVGQQLLERLQPQLNDLDEHACFLDLGSGTGHFTGQVASLYPQIKCLGIDFARGMIDFARARHSGCLWCCGDAEQLPLANNSIDAIYSNMTLQWCEDLPVLAMEIYRVLKPGGRAVLSTLTTGTLHELRSAWQRADGEVHVNRFQSAEFWQQTFAEQFFTKVSLTSETRVTRYRTALELARELKTLGAHNVNDGRNKKLTGKQRLNTFAEAYEPFRESDSGLLPATWQVAFIELKKGLELEKGLEAEKGSELEKDLELTKGGA